MGGLFGGGGTISNAETRLNAFRTSTSCYGGVIPIVFNTTRISGNLIDYLDFTAIPHTTTQHAGKGGGTDVENTTYTYTVAAAIAICEGEVQIGRIWAEKEIKKLDELNMTLFYNKVWPYVVGKYDERAVTYKNVSYAAGVCDLGSRDTMPQLNFEVSGVQLPSHEIILRLLTDTNYGVGLEAKFVGDMLDFKNYCTAANIQLAAGLVEEREAQELLGDLVKCTNSEFLWTNGKLTIQPCAETAFTGGGASFTPTVTVRYDLTDDDFVDQDGDDPVQVLRSISADAYNCIKVEFTNSENEYNSDIAEAKDTADIEFSGIREAETVSLPYIHDRNTATSIAYMLLHRNLYVRNRCKFVLSLKHCLLEPFDIVTVTDRALGYDKRPFRILEITENDDGTSEYEAEECLLGVDFAIFDTKNPLGNIYVDDTNVGKVNAPVLLVPPFAMTGGKLQIWLAVSGAQKDWGGCQIWTSYDNASYRFISNQYGPSVTGRLVNAVTSSATEIIIDVSESRCELYSVSAVDAQNFVSLCYLDGEYFTYQTAELIGTKKYRLKLLVRGLHGVAAKAHEAGAEFAKLDGTVKRMEIVPSQANQAIYLKYPSFDTKGNHMQMLDAADAYTYYIKFPNMPEVVTLRLTKSGDAGIVAEFTVQQSSEYLFSEVYYREEVAAGTEPNEYSYAGTDRQRIAISGLTAGKTYTVKVLPVITGNLKGALDTAKSATITL